MNREGHIELKKYVWGEDSKSGFDFWKRVFDTLYEGYIVESKKTRIMQSCCKHDNGEEDSSFLP